ncbi:MAG: hypothetical protein AAGG07_06155 [Planctomycetota bacterium]
MRTDRPIRVLQFGTGVLLRGLCDEIIDRALNDGSHRWDGAVAVVQSTGTTRADALRESGGRYAVRTRGLTTSGPVDESRTTTCIGESLAAERDWQRVIELARSPDLGVILSNTTEAGLHPSEADRPDDPVPLSYPAKLLRVLLERARTGLPGLIVIPCELVERNGDVLRTAVETLAGRFGVHKDEASWIRDEVVFASSLVDRICTRPSAAKPSDLGVVIEPFAQWVIEARESDRKRLSFAQGVAGAELVDNVDPYFTRKVRVLNGAHTSIVNLGLLAGMSTVRELCDDPDFEAFLSAVLDRDILPPLVAAGVPGVREFAAGVVDRFANPFAVHRLSDIASGTETKIRVRLLPTIAAHGSPPPCLSLGLAAWLAQEQRTAPLEWPAPVRRAVSEWTRVLESRGVRESMNRAIAGAR